MLGLWVEMPGPPASSIRVECWEARAGTSTVRNRHPAFKCLSRFERRLPCCGREFAHFFVNCFLTELKRWFHSQEKKGPRHGEQPWPNRPRWGGGP